MHAGSRNKKKKKKKKANNNNNSNNHNWNNSHRINTMEKFPTELTKRDKEFFGFHWKYSQETSRMFCWIHIIYSLLYCILLTQTHSQWDISHHLRITSFPTTSHFCHFISFSLSPSLYLWRTLPPPRLFFAFLLYVANCQKPPQNFFTIRIQLKDSSYIYRK